MLRYETAGESHGESLVALLTGLPAGVPISLEKINREGQDSLTREERRTLEKASRRYQQKRQ